MVVIGSSQALVKHTSSYKETVFLQGLFSRLETMSYLEITLPSLKGGIGLIWGPGFLAHQSYGYEKDDWVFLFEKHLSCLESLKKEGAFVGLSSKEILFEVMMDDFERMKTYGQGYINLLKRSEPLKTLWSSSGLLKNLKVILSHRMVQAFQVSLLEKSPSIYEVMALVLIYLRSLWVFAHDETEDLTETMASVNEGLCLLGEKFQNEFEGFQDP